MEGNIGPQSIMWKLAGFAVRTIEVAGSLGHDNRLPYGQDMERDRFTVQEAARLLGVSEGAIRKRVARGALEHDKEPDGRVYVYLEVADARGTRGVDAGQDIGVDPHNDALIFQLRDEIEYLREESRRKDEIIMQQALTMRQLTAGSEEPENVAPGRQEEEPPESAGGPENQSSRPWWRRIFGL